MTAALSPLSLQAEGPPADTVSVTVKRACLLTGLSHTTIYKLIALGRLRSVKIGRRTLISYESLRGLVEAA